MADGLGPVAGVASAQNPERCLVITVEYKLVSKALFVEYLIYQT